ncbi:hypothetical protein CMQ_7327 [Grosmannia clavigera kw1407]|uniref:Uncharacterized protein n=1 Tax=Grosmannia clavigera (strain kw1407 / UAMH 11150) TaxID=655863 RepID=F0XQ79_GROCL|nr:uncharacterized protein CMQ_7327 [Grosmannia clavigera kw1407]EFX00325.1 hypothetical protein CMQ_7327 [Grosmannia clavigera kw1407]
MAPIHIYSQSPINAAKPDGVTPQTDGPTDEKAPNAHPATTSAAVFTGAASGGPPARPGAVPSLPQPTGAPRINRYQPVQPTPTAKAANAGPPPPQPGAVPLPPSRGPPTDAQIFPNPAQQTPVPSAADASAALPNQYPPQMSIPPLTSAAYPPPRGTYTSVQPQAPTGTWPSIPQPTGVFAVPPPVDERYLGHPPGYTQNAHAGDMNSSERAAAQAEVYGSEDKDGVWDVAKKLARAAGDRISAAETEVWRRINSESG